MKSSAPVTLWKTSKLKEQSTLADFSMTIRANDEHKMSFLIFIHFIKLVICGDSAEQCPHQVKYLTWHSVGFAGQQCTHVAILAGHNCERHPCLERYMKQNTAVLPSKSRGGPGVVNVDLHHCLAQVLTTQHIIDLHL